MVNRPGTEIVVKILCLSWFEIRISFPGPVYAI